LLCLPLHAQTVPAPRDDAAAENKSAAVKLDEFVVTGVFNATEARKATTAITAIDSDLLATQIPLSADDMLLNVAGVFVNSSLGEIRGMVYSRGISADSSDGATGQYYVSMQEDGLPITNVNFSNYGAGYLQPARRHASARRGRARRQRVDHVVQLTRRRVQLHQSRRLRPFRRRAADATRARGPQLAALPRGLHARRPARTKGLGVQCRRILPLRRGHRPPDGYPMNNGFDVRGNLFRDYGHGSVKIYGKYLDDRNHWYEYLLARDPENPKQYPGLSRYSTNLFPKSSHQYPREAEDQFATFDTADTVRSRQRYVGVEWKHELGDGWSFNHNVKFSRGWADWNSSSGVTPRNLEWPNFFSTMSIQYSGGSLSGRVPAGLYRFSDRKTGAVLAEVTSNCTYSVNANALSNPGQIVRFANLPNGQILPNALWTNVGRVANEHMNEIMENLRHHQALPRDDVHRRRLLRLRGYLGSSKQWRAHRVAAHRATAAPRDHVDSSHRSHRARRHPRSGLDRDRRFRRQTGAA
jgi:hypothetical protein